MSQQSYVYLSHDRLPSGREWAAAIRRRGFDLGWGDDFDPLHFGGILAVVLQGVESDFGYDLEHPLSDGDVPAEVQELSGDCDAAAVFQSWSTDEQCYGSLIAALVLTEIVGGIYYFDGETVTADQAAACLVRDLPLAFRPGAPPVDQGQGTTPAVWRARCHEILRAIDGGYAPNPAVRGASVEFVRRHDSGLYVSHSFEHRGSSSGVRSYRHSFALLFSPGGPREYYVSPLEVGGRLGEPDIAKAFTDHLLLPFYLKVVETAAFRYRSLFGEARTLLSRWGADLERQDAAFDHPGVVGAFCRANRATADELGRDRKDLMPVARALDCAASCGLDAPELLRHLDQARYVDGFSFATGRSSAEEIPARLRNACLVVHHIRDFRRLSGELDAILEVVAGLEKTSTSWMTRLRRWITGRS